MSARVTVTMAAIAVAMAMSACASNQPPPPRSGGGPELVAGGAIFRYTNRDARTVHLVGDFNDWAPTTDPMIDENGDGDWTLFYPLEPGRYAYKFVIDGTRWIPDPSNANHEPDGFDGRNSVVIVPIGVPGGQTR